MRNPENYRPIIGYNYKRGGCIGDEMHALLFASKTVHIMLRTKLHVSDCRRSQIIIQNYHT